MTRSARRLPAPPAPALPTGVGIDAHGGPVIDPTANVIALVKANAKSAEMLRNADTKYTDCQHAHLKELGGLRAAHAETLRVSDLDRLDKTRQVDVLAGTASAAALATAVQTLANTSDRNAETLRNLVNATAATMAKQTSDQAAILSSQTDSLMRDVNARIAELQKASYQGVGKSSVADPMMAEFIAEMRVLAKGQDRRTGKTEGLDTGWKILIAVAGLLFAFLTWQSRSAANTPPPQPQVIVVPAGTPSPGAVTTGPPTQVRP